MMKSALPSVTVAVLTYQRNADLRELLPMLQDQIVSVPNSADVLVVDNDPDGGAQAEVSRNSDGISYVHEPEPGIAAARNRVLAEVDADVLVFIDDDERPSADWLAGLLAASENGSVAVVGPVESTYAGEAEPWVLAGNFFRRRRLTSGTHVEMAATNNLLLPMAKVGSLQFDARFGITGGSDTLFTRQYVAAGNNIVWCDQALVTDVVPIHRLQRSWVLQKAYRIGNTTVRIDSLLAGGRVERAGVRVKAMGSGTARVVAGECQRLAGVLLHRLSWQAQGARKAARGKGLAAGALGKVYSEYSREGKS